MNDYILFETQANIAEFVSFLACGVVFGIFFKIFKCKTSFFRSILVFALLAISICICMLAIEKSHLGYQTFLVPLVGFGVTIQLHFNQKNSLQP